MGTLIQDAAEVATLATAIDTAIVAKGGTLVGGGKLRNAAAGIATIKGWQKPDEWPDFQKIFDTYECPDGYDRKVGVLCNSIFDYLNFPLPGNNLDNIRYRSSDAPNEIKSFTSTPCSVPMTTGDYRWAIVYYKTSAVAETTVLNICQSGNNYNRGPSYLWIISRNTTVGMVARFGANLQCVDVHYLKCESYSFECSGICKLKADKVILYSAADNLFNYCNNLSEVDVAEWDVSACNSFVAMFRYSGIVEDPGFAIKGSCGNLFYGCRNLKSIKNRDYSQVTSANGLFYGCNSLSDFPDDVDLSGCTASMNNFSTVDRAMLKNAPRNMQSNASFNLFTGTTLWTDAFDKTSFAKFDSEGNIISGCFVYNLNTISSGLTVTVSSTIKSLFTSTEQATIEDALTDKGWTIAW